MSDIYLIDLDGMCGYTTCWDLYLLAGSTELRADINDDENEYYTLIIL